MCEADKQWARARLWINRAVSQFGKTEWQQVEELAKEILDLLNSSNASNAVKLVALVHTAMSGADHLHNHHQLEDAKEVSTTVH